MVTDCSAWLRGDEPITLSVAEGNETICFEAINPLSKQAVKHPWHDRWKREWAKNKYSGGWTMFPFFFAASNAGGSNDVIANAFLFRRDNGGRRASLGNAASGMLARDILRHHGFNGLKFTVIFNAVPLVPRPEPHWLHALRQDSFEDSGWTKTDEIDMSAIPALQFAITTAKVHFHLRREHSLAGALIGYLHERAEGRANDAILLLLVEGLDWQGGATMGQLPAPIEH